MTTSERRAEIRRLEKALLPPEMPRTLAPWEARLRQQWQLQLRWLKPKTKEQR